MRNSRISLSSDEIDIHIVWVDVRLQLSVYPAHLTIPLAHSLLDVAKNCKFSSVGYFIDNTSMTSALLPKSFLLMSLPARETWLFMFIFMFLSW